MKQQGSIYTFARFYFTVVTTTATTNAAAIMNFYTQEPLKEPEMYRASFILVSISNNLKTFQTANSREENKHVTF
jgi:hypothetical protein